MRKLKAFVIPLFIFLTREIHSGYFLPLLYEVKVEDDKAAGVCEDIGGFIVVEHN